jgi:DNA invertase Pin-like site-specific DNA recombinase
MKAAVYLRVSSKGGRQDEGNQEPECLRLCAARGWEPIVIRERESGAKDRPEWRRVLELARLGEVRAVVFWRLDRTGRSRVQVAHDLGELFRFRVDVASVKDGWLDIGASAGPLRDLLVQVMAWMAEGERDALIERTRAGIAAARRRGVRLGRRPVDRAKLDVAVSLVLGSGLSISAAARKAGVTKGPVARAVKAYGKGAAGGGPPAA